MGHERRRLRDDENRSNENSGAINSDGSLSDPSSISELHNAVKAGIVSTMGPEEEQRILGGVSSVHSEFCTSAVDLWQHLSPSKAKKGDFITNDNSIALDHLYGYILEAKNRVLCS